MSDLFWKEMYLKIYGKIDLGPEAGFSGSTNHLILHARGWFVDTVFQLGPWSKRSPEPDGMSFEISGSVLPEGDAVMRSVMSDGFFRAVTGNRRVEIVRGAHGAREEQVSCVPGAWLQAVKDTLRGKGPELSPELMA